MCIIINGLKKNLVREELEEGIRRNSSGNFIAVIRGKKIETAVRDLNSESILATFDKAEPDDEILLHARIPSQGTKTLENVHGWKSEEGMFFCHNGTMGTLEKWGDHTDSETFFRKIFLPCWRGEGRQFTENVEYLIRHFLGTYNKFAFITPDGEIKLYGNFIEDHNCRFSNSSYKSYTAATTKTSWAKTDRSLSDYYDHDYDYDYDYSHGFDCGWARRDSDPVTDVTSIAAGRRAEPEEDTQTPGLLEVYPTIRELAKAIAELGVNTPKFSVAKHGDEVVRAVGIPYLLRDSVKAYVANCAAANSVAADGRLTQGMFSDAFGRASFMADPEETAETFLMSFTEFTNLENPVKTREFLDCVDGVLDSMLFASGHAGYSVYSRTSSQMISDIRTMNTGIDVLLAITGTMYNPDLRKTNLVYASKTVMNRLNSGKVKFSHVERPIHELILPPVELVKTGTKELKIKTTSVRELLVSLLDLSDIIDAKPVEK